MADSKAVAPKGENPRDRARRWRREAEADPTFGFSDPERIKYLYARLRGAR